MKKSYHKLLIKFFFKFLNYILKKRFFKNFSFSLSIFNINEIDIYSDIIESNEYGILFQGPIFPNTYNLINLYRKKFPNCSILLSTWKGQKINFNYNNIEVIYSDIPKLKGIMNFNLQLVSTSNGLKSFEKNQKIKKIFKIRTDYAPLRPTKIIRTVDIFEKKLDVTDRIWGIDINTSKNIPYSFSDIFQFSSKQNLNDYWLTAKPQNHDIDSKSYLRLTDNLNDLKKIFEYQPSEIYLMINYLKSKNININYLSLDDYYKILGKYFGILDANDIGFAFDKYSIVHPQSCENISSIFSKHQNMTFSDWLHYLDNSSKNENI